MSEDQKQVGFLRRMIAQGEKFLGKLQKQEKTSRERWTKRYRRYNDSAAKLASLKSTATKKADELRKVILNWQDESAELTRERDAKRAAMRREEEVLQQRRVELAVLEERMRNLSAQTDRIVEQVFALNDTSVAALNARNDFLSANVYHLLLDSDGNLRSQVTLDSSDGKCRVVALVNHLSRIDAAFAGEAKEHIDRFLARFSETSVTGQDPQVLSLIEMLKTILIEKISFKVGPALYQFLSVEINPEVFPELQSAQHLLRNSLRSEKTNSYVRLYRRESRDKPWVEVKLT